MSIINILFTLFCCGTLVLSFYIGRKLDREELDKAKIFAYFAISAMATLAIIGLIVIWVFAK